MERVLTYAKKAKKNFPKFTIELSRRVKFQMLMVLQVTLISTISLEEIFYYFRRVT